MLGRELPPAAVFFGKTRPTVRPPRWISMIPLAVLELTRSLVSPARACLKKPFSSSSFSRPPIWSLRRTF